MSGNLGAIASVVGHFQTQALSTVLVTLCSGTDETHSGSGRDLQHVQIRHASNGFFSKEEWTLHFQRLTGDHLISACTNIQFQ
jgi:hypothetical protein